MDNMTSVDIDMQYIKFLIIKIQIHKMEIMLFQGNVLRSISTKWGV